MFATRPSIQIDFWAPKEHLAIELDGSQHRSRKVQDAKRMKSFVRMSARIDCNRGRGTWKSFGPNQLEFGPLALTRAMCPPESLHDRIVKDWGFVRSYVIKDGHLFLSLMADGGIYEFEPIGGSKLLRQSHRSPSRALSTTSVSLEAGTTR
jgi:heat shock protein HslJ